ncbi:phosphate ABC transporter permease subunit PstC [Gymnodinialimonas ceratoperidinii]|uniref:Phosphate transport system permease protein n=1 Tax=Gymnodinialimonas ceratoperidinii TaxID=2856823 RepID=A0A8F6Y8Y1_9RHOB|nr:phosphate ABC transporter permease subunit PstC [Gymnodinialimonas ceratoperidinii]QXT38364.1 phosphate ABC transporter permease subunit PstC [Gymnodinialimonas ceratoperidinii]
MLWILFIIVALGTLGFVLGRGRAISSAGGDTRLLHSLPTYYGLNVALLTVVPALLVLVVWLVVQPMVVDGMIAASMPATEADQGARDLLMTDVRRLADGIDTAIDRGAFSAGEAQVLSASEDIRAQLAAAGVALGSDVSDEVLVAAQRARALNAAGRIWMLIVVGVLAIAGLTYAFLSTHKNQRARNAVERAILGLLITASTIAILTTVGIVLSMLWDTANFFQLYPWQDFFFGLEWRPSFEGNSELGLLPLLWGTMYISFIALLVAVPIGLFAAIYMAEYASNRVRSVAKPMIEVLAGIPTIVYGLFALITVGPMLRDYFAQPLGLGDSSSSVMTAGIVMGIMLIPFVSSLSDDIINSVPQNLRDGSFGLGATQSETIKQVVLPAALPGIVGAVLLAASRAIGETMIVVLGAGAAARLDLNPFEAMTTVTVKIVGQLTGDTDFSSPEALVAFALGLTLFVLTLALNVVALLVVRKYREQYE